MTAKVTGKSLPTNLELASQVAAYVAKSFLNLGDFPRVELVQVKPQKVHMAVNEKLFRVTEHNLFVVVGSSFTLGQILNGSDLSHLKRFAVHEGQINIC